MAVGGIGGIITIAAGIIPLSGVLLIWFGFGYSNPWLWGFAAALSISAALWGVTWTQVALIDAALSEAPSIEAWAVYRESWKKLASFSWVCFLAFLAAVGGIYLFIVPGIFLAFALTFAPFVCAAENKSGLEALETSLAYVKGLWAGVAGRLIFISLGAWVLSKIPLLGIISGIFTLPFALIFTTLLYLRLRKNPAARSFPHARGLLIFSFAGLLIPVLFAFRIASLWPQIHAEILREMRPFLSGNIGAGFP